MQGGYALTLTWQSEPPCYRSKGTHWDEANLKSAWVGQRILEENESEKIVYILSVVPAQPYKG